MHYVYAGDEVVDEFDSSSGLLPLQNRYELGAGEVVKGELRNEPTNYYFSDALGSTTNLSQLNGTQSFSTSTSEYDSFGKVNNQTGASANSIGYTGQRLDTETGLMALGNGERYYSPALARFTQQDSFSGLPTVPQSLNRYAYTVNNPLLHTDPSGHIAPLVVAAIIGAVAGGGLGASYSYEMQNAQIKDGLRRPDQFSWTDVIESGVKGAIVGAATPFVAAAAIAYAPIAAPLLVAGGFTISGSQVIKGHYEAQAGYKNVGAVEQKYGWIGVGLSFLGLAGLKGGVKANAAPKVLEENPLLVETEPAPLRLGDGGRGQQKLLNAAPEEIVNPPRQPRFIGQEEGAPKDLSTGRGNPNLIGQSSESIKGEIAINEEHIFNGEIRTPNSVHPQGKAVGFHYEGIENESQSRSTTLLNPPNSEGVYVSEVEIFNNRTGALQAKRNYNNTANGRSTFFPEHWTKAEVLLEIRGAFANQKVHPNNTLMSGTGNTFVGNGPKGLEVQGHIRTDGVIETAHPSY